MKNNSRFYQCKTLQEALYHLKNVNNLKIYSGGTTIKTDSNPNRLDIGDDCLFLTNCEELKKIEKHERYITFGSSVPLQKILDLGKSKIPDFLYEAIETVANPIIRCRATLAGNICATDFFHTLYSPLLAIDTRVEIHTPTETKQIPISKFNGIENGQIMTSLRIPLIEWDIAHFTRLGLSNQISDVSSSFTFLAKTQKDSLTDIRIAFCGKIKIRSTELENSILGAHLPLSHKNIKMTLDKASKIFDEEVEYSIKKSLMDSPNAEPTPDLSQKIENAKKDYHPMIKEQFLNLLKMNLEKLM
ncbi:MAG: FAD binding domain-containing protein [Treponemataceae bacterium]|nr:FAD binding domain-containing protein [Spirochaetales bacterium]MDY6031684.1 FAD binding domain-containing protein [Treponemataceae bacterium]